MSRFVDALNRSPMSPIIPGRPTSTVQIAADPTTGFERCVPAGLDEAVVVVFATSRQDVTLRWSDGARPDPDVDDPGEWTLVGRVPVRVELDRGVSLWYSTGGSSNSGHFLAYAVG